MKRCCRCGLVKEDSQFSSRNYKGNRILTSYCNKCNAEMTAVYRKRMKDNDPRMFWCHSTLRGHKFRGYIINITKEELREFVNDKFTCNICGCELAWNNKRGKIIPQSPTLDRTDCEQEINISNIQIICQKCNRIKQDMTMKEMLDYCRHFVKKFGDTDGRNQKVC